MAVIGTGSANYELSLLNLDSAEVEIMFSVDAGKGKDIVAPPVVASYIPESISFDGRNETNKSLFDKYLLACRNN